MQKDLSLNSSRKWLEKPFFYFISQYKTSFFLGLMALLLTNFFDILGPLFIGRVIDALSESKLSNLKLDLFLLLCVSFGTALFRYLWRIYFGEFHHSVAADLRKILFRKMLSLGQNFHQKMATGEKMTLITQDIENFRMGIGPGLLIFFDAIIYLLGLIPLMLWIDVSWTLKTLALMPLIPIVMYKLETTLNNNYRKLQDETGELTSFAQETVSGIKVIKSLGISSLRSQIFSKTNSRLRDYGIQMDRIESAFSPSLEFFIMIGTATLLFVGADKVVTKEISVGSFFTFYQYLLRMIWPMSAIGFSFMMYKEAESSFDRIKEVLVLDPWIPDGTHAASKGHDISVKNLSFRYSPEENWALQNISFDLKAHESMAIVGPVGSGKSTLANLLAKSLPPTEGEILYSHRNLLEIQKGSYSSVMTLVPQRVFLFKKSISENVLDFANTNNDQDLHSLLNQVFISEEITSMPKKEKTLLEENGQGLSGGQRQRLSLARGLAQTPQWLVLDDTLSAVDIETEQKIIESLLVKKNKSNMNFIFCSHRIQNLKWVDKILVLNEGKVVDMGRHEELYERCSLYRDLYSSQKSPGAHSPTLKPISTTESKVIL